MMKISLNDAMDELYKYWAMSLTIFLGVSTGMILIPDSKETGMFFIMLTLIILLIQQGFMFYFYDIEELNEKEVINWKQKE